MAGLIQKQALYEQVADQLRQRIYDREYEPGQAIDERALCEQFGISRTPLREALKVLSREGLVELKPNRGCFVRDVDFSELAELFPVMSVLEGLSARQAVEKMTMEDLRELEKIHADLEELAAEDDITAYYECNSVFHLKIQTLSGNRWLQQLGSDLRRILKLARHSQLTVPGRLQASLDEHRSIMQALQEKDAAKAEQLMQAHLMAQWQVLEKHFLQEAAQNNKQSA